MRALLLVVLLALSTAAPTFAAKPTTAECWFADGWLYATGLPIGVAFAITADPIPTGVTRYTEDGTFSGPSWAIAAYFWVRKGGGGLFKPGAQLNDYKPIAECHA